MTMQVAFRQEAGESAPIQGCQDLGILLTYTWIGILYNYDDRSYRIGEFFFVLNETVDIVINKIGHSRNAKNCITDVSVSDTRPHPCLPRSNSISIAPGGRPPPRLPPCRRCRTLTGRAASTPLALGHGNPPQVP